MKDRAAIYARFSTERQDERSIADQMRLCRERADSLGLHIVLTKSDEGVSGATPVQVRPGSSGLLAAAMAGQFDILIVEGLERLSRDLIDSETVCRRLEHRGIRIIGIGDGYDSASGDSRELLRGVRGLFNQSYLRDASKKTHRGLVGQVSRGFHAGGMSFGYRSTAVDMNERGEAAGFRLEIVPEQAKVVRWIFGRYAEGWSCQRIAADAQKDRGAAVCTGVASPRAETDRRLIGVLREEILSPAAIASIRARVQQLLADATKAARIDVETRTERMRQIDHEIERLTDAIAQMGLSDAIRARLTLAESEKRSLLVEPASVPAISLPSSERISAKLREVAMRLDDALKTDVPRARQIVSEMLGPTVIEEADDGIYAQMNVGPGLLIAVGANSSKNGCGGLQPRPETRLRVV